LGGWEAGRLEAQGSKVKDGKIEVEKIGRWEAIAEDRI